MSPALFGRLGLSYLQSLCCVCACGWVYAGMRRGVLCNMLLSLVLSDRTGRGQHRTAAQRRRPWFEESCKYVAGVPEALGKQGPVSVYITPLPLSQLLPLRAGVQCLKRRRTATPRMLHIGFSQGTAQFLCASVCLVATNHSRRQKEGRKAGRRTTTQHAWYSGSGSGSSGGKRHRAGELRSQPASQPASRRDGGRASCRLGTSLATFSCMEAERNKRKGKLSDWTPRELES